MRDRCAHECISGPFITYFKRGSGKVSDGLEQDLIKDFAAYLDDVKHAKGSRWSPNACMAAVLKLALSKRASPLSWGQPAMRLKERGKFSKVVLTNICCLIGGEKCQVFFVQ